MVVFSRIATSLIAASLVSASPWPITSKHATHRVRAVVDGKEINAYHPPNNFEVFGEGISHPLEKRGPQTSSQEVAEKFIESKLGLTSSDFAFNKGFDGDVVKHAYFKQKLNGITVANAVANVAINKDNKISAFGNNFVTPVSVASSSAKLTSAEAIAKAESTLSGTYNSHPTGLEYFIKEDGTAVLTHVVQVQNDKHWFEAFVDAHSGEVVSANDFTASLSYRVVPFQDQDLTDEGIKLLVNPEDTAASPQGWVTSTTTAGNNAVSFKGSQSAVAQQSSSGVFDYTFSASADPTTSANLAQAKVNAFYIVNSVHDVTYRYGFTESAFNFQNNNFGKGGAQNDRITISVQNSAGTDNADFSTPPDGQSGAMRMFLWDLTSPERDGARENDIVTHEATHGTSNRLTGGGTGRCLQSTEAGGMGEGWSDAFADWAEQTSAPIADFTLGTYVEENTAGIRSHPYSTSSTVNPLTYASLQTLTEVHSIGEVWANILHNVHAALVTAHGFSSTAKTNPSGTEGNVVFMHLFIDQLALQPCSPTFLTARSAWIQADANRFGGANKCLLWKAFASRGLGVNAANHKNDATVPAGC